MEWNDYLTSWQAGFTYTKNKKQEKLHHRTLMVKCSKLLCILNRTPDYTLDYNLANLITWLRVRMHVVKISIKFRYRMHERNWCKRGSVFNKWRLIKVSLTGLQSQFWFCLCKTWLEGCRLQISLSNKLFRPGINRNSASILWTCVRERVCVTSPCTGYHNCKVNITIISCIKELIHAHC